MCREFYVMSYDEALEVAECLACRAPLPACPDWPARPVRAFPGSVVPAIVADCAGGLCVREFTWGFPVAWKKGLVFNTRFETATGPRPGMWAEPLARGRCLVPAFGFVETHAHETEPSPRTGRTVRARYRFGLADGEPLLLAGVSGAAEEAVGDGAAACLPRLSLVTTEPNLQVAPVHNRMPLALCGFEALRWLGEGFAQLADRSGVVLSAAPVRDDAPAAGMSRNAVSGQPGAAACAPGDAGAAASLPAAQLSLF